MNMWYFLKGRVLSQGHHSIQIPNQVINPLKSSSGCRGLDQTKSWLHATRRSFKRNFKITFTAPVFSKIIYSFFCNKPQFSPNIWSGLHLLGKPGIYKQWFSPNLVPLFTQQVQNLWLKIWKIHELAWRSFKVYLQLQAMVRRRAARASCCDLQLVAPVVCCDFKCGGEIFLRQHQLCHSISFRKTPKVT